MASGLNRVIRDLAAMSEPAARRPISTISAAIGNRVRPCATVIGEFAQVGSVLQAGRLGVAQARELGRVFPDPRLAGPRTVTYLREANYGAGMSWSTT